MFNLFKNRRPEETAYDQYKRLVTVDASEGFLDIDTTLIMGNRDEIESQIAAGKSNIDTDELSHLDRIFREKVESDLLIITKKIKDNDPSADYLKGMLLDLTSYGSNEPKTKWWFHLFD